MNSSNENYSEKGIGLPKEATSSAGIANDGTKVYLGSESLTWDAKQRKEAIAKGVIKPAMAYSQQEYEQNASTGLFATQATVEEQVSLRENTPRG